jgi:predicted lipoprotein with Yx(FWY)xxD motif
MKRKKIIIIVAVAVLLLGGTFFVNGALSPTKVDNSVLKTANDSKTGDYMADKSGRPLYYYGKDTAGVSNCIEACQTTWQPYLASGDTSKLPAGVSFVTRSDGSKQYTYNGKPLYYNVNDPASNPGGSAGGGSGGSSGGSGGGTGGGSTGGSNGGSGGGSDVTGDGQDGFTVTNPEPPDTSTPHPPVVNNGIPF